LSEAFLWVWTGPGERRSGQRAHRIGLRRGFNPAKHQEGVFCLRSGALGFVVILLAVDAGS